MQVYTLRKSLNTMLNCVLCTIYNIKNYVFKIIFQLIMIILGRDILFSFGELLLNKYF